MRWLGFTIVLLLATPASAAQNIGDWEISRNGLTCSATLTGAQLATLSIEITRGAVVPNYGSPTLVLTGSSEDDVMGHGELGFAMLEDGSGVFAEISRSQMRFDADSRWFLQAMKRSATIDAASGSHHVLSASLAGFAEALKAVQALCD